MISAFELTWKVSGLIPIPMEGVGKYFLFADDENFSKRVFGCPELRIKSQSLVPTKQFQQALDAELRRKHGISVGTTGNPLSVPFGNFGNCLVNLRFRILGEAVLILTIQVQKFSRQLTAPDLIPIQRLSYHPILESIARFCFNVHFAPLPSEVEVEGFQSKPLLRIEADQGAVKESDLAAIVTRHIGLNERATQEMLKKNETTNFNDDLVFIDKQGVVFLEVTTDSKNQRNRFTRISSLCEYALYANAIQSVIAECSQDSVDRVTGDINGINAVIEADVLSQSVSAKRSWELIKAEFGLRKIDLLKFADDIAKETKRERVPFYKNPIFIGTSTLIAFAGGIIRLVKYFNLW